MPLILTRRALIEAGVLASGLVASGAAFAAEPKGFTHCVASGDPHHDRVTLWTRYVAPDETRLRVEVANDPRFSDIVARGEAVAQPINDHCVHAVPTGLKPGRWYYYRFVAPGGEASPTGRTRTLPTGPLDRFRMGVMCCANATSGWFTAYGHAAARDDLDLIVHLGDYIYESPIDRSDALAKLAAMRGIRPAGEAISLADYRLRYASYRDDRNLQELHRRYPMIAIRDDHETANNSWRYGASNNEPEEGDGPWPIREAAALRAWGEWMPMGDRWYDAYQIGDLATLFRVDTRNLARTKQLDLGDAVKGAADPAAAITAFRDGPLADPARTLMGASQEAWLADGFARSKRAGTRWQVLAQQVVMGSRFLPQSADKWFAPGTAPSHKDQRELALATVASKLGVPIAMDSWDGYPAARERLLKSAIVADADLVTLSGDSHNAWAFDLAQGTRSAGAEFAVQGVSSLGIDKKFDGDPHRIAADFIAAAPALKWCDTSQRGYMVTELTPRAARNEWIFLPSRHSRSLEVIGRHEMVVEHGARRLA